MGLEQALNVVRWQITGRIGLFCILVRQFDALLPPVLLRSLFFLLWSYCLFVAAIALVAEGGAGAGGEGGGREDEKANGHLFHGEEILGADEKEAEKEKNHR